VRGYSILKGQFLYQTGPNMLVLDPDFGFSILASVDLSDFYLVTNAFMRLPSGSRLAMEDMGDSWVYLDSFSSWSALNADYGWGNYTMDFTTVNEGAFSCPLSLPSTPLPPKPRLTNYDEVQFVNASQSLKLDWDYTAAPADEDFVQVYISLGHASVFSTPDIGLEGALDGTDRSVTVPANTLEPGLLYSLTLEITRLVSSNTTSYPNAEGVTGTFSSTSLYVMTLLPPELRVLPPASPGTLPIEVLADPESTIVLQQSHDFVEWTNVETNTSPSGSLVFTVPTSGQAAGFFRALQQ
jgi:hypothetical protein